MRTAWKIAASAAALTLVVGSSHAASPWLHVQVDEHDGGGAKVNVNLPLSLVRVALEVIEDQDVLPEQIELRGSELEVADIKRLWHELRVVGDAELVEIDDDGDHVRVWMDGDRLKLRVTEEGDDTGKVEVEVPVSVVDALFEGDSDSLNLRAALAVLDPGFRGDLVRVEDGDTSVRIWID